MSHYDLVDDPHYALLLSESYESPSERAWLAWVKAVEKRLGHSLDCHQDVDGYSLDYAFAAFEGATTPAAYAGEVKVNKAAQELLGPRL